MSYKLYSHKGSGGFVVEAGLLMAGQPYESIDVDTKNGEQFSDAFRAINPWSQVPALSLPDGTVMTESAAIVIHIAAAFPEANLAPAPGTEAHADFLRWIVFMTVNIYEADLHMYYPERYTTDPSGAAAIKDAGADHMRRGLATMDALLADRQFVLGDEISIADVYLSMMRVWYRDPLDLPNIARVMDAIRQHEIVGPLWQKHYPGR